MKGTKKLTLAAMFCALAFVATALIRVPVVSFLKYEPKDVIITLGGLILGPLYALIISVVTSIIEMITISDTGVIGMVMNVLSSSAFAVTASLIYKKKRTLTGAIIGLTSGCVIQVVVMMLWNYIMVPIYMNLPREQVVGMLMPVFLPFNLIKGILNASMTFLLYKPVIGTLRKTRMIEAEAVGSKKTYIPLVIAACFILLTCALIILALNGRI